MTEMLLVKVYATYGTKILKKTIKSYLPSFTNSGFLHKHIANIALYIMLNKKYCYRDEIVKK